MLIADSGAGSDPTSMALQIAPGDLLAAAQHFEAAADKAGAWLLEWSQDFLVEPAGADKVSKNVAGWLTDNAHGLMGAVPAVQQAMRNLRAAATQMRSAAATYGLTEQDATADINAAATP